MAGHCRSCGLVVNTSSVGLQAGDPAILPAACLDGRQRVYDTIYQPPVTPLLALAAGLGCQTASGWSLLLHQGVLAFQLWFPASEPLAAMRTALGR